MQLKLSICSFVLIATASVNPAWTFAYYTDPDFRGGGFIHNGNGDGCFGVEPALADDISSFIWKSDPACDLILYALPSCEQTLMTVAAPQAQFPNMLNMDDQTASFRVTC